VIPEALLYEAKAWKHCDKCRLSRTRRRVVYGSGRYAVPLVILGQAPGAEEDKTGKPFQGRAGKLIRKTFEDIGFDMEDAFTVNTVACFPPGNRAPVASEVNACRKLFDAAIRILQPSLILAVGAVPLTALTGEVGIGKHHGKMLPGYVFNDAGELEEFKALATFHPSGLLRSHSKERTAAFKQDLSLAVETVTG